ncbi:hypothetical protein TNIN_302671 [Trichonephila inaurata madagascariensis]|uniref:Uncharacterized protein n=1 Tax=Trichonephila inaurata madagascariensis TaxID=2747483 RepID=A0A8X6WT36_9ARAC|nr:hypothetical protein TNIN_302671 [Trichonephila inaurata madagascariensis]
MWGVEGRTTGPVALKEVDPLSSPAERNKERHVVFCFPAKRRPDARRSKPTPERAEPQQTAHFRIGKKRTSRFVY